VGLLRLKSPSRHVRKYRFRWEFAAGCSSSFRVSRGAKYLEDSNHQKMVVSGLCVFRTSLVTARDRPSLRIV